MKQDKKTVLKEIARDLMALGGVPFLVLVLVRVFMVDNYREVFNIAAAVILVVIVSFIMKNVDYHAAIIPILVIFTSIFYNDNLYTIFAVVVGIAAIVMIRLYLKKKNIYKSAVLGILCSIASYFIAMPLNLPVS